MTGPAVGPAGASSRGLLLTSCTAGVLLAGLLVPGGGLVVAVVLAATVLRGTAASRWLLALGAALLALALGVHTAPWTQPVLHVGPAVPVSPAS